MEREGEKALLLVLMVDRQKKRVQWREKGC